MSCLTFSLVTYLAPQFPLTSPVSKTLGPHYTTEWSAINPQGLQGCKGDPLCSLAQADITGNRHTTQNFLPSHEAAVISADTRQVTQPMSLLHFPPELMTRILLYLSPLDIISCGRTCRILYDLCNDSALRYLVQTERCAVSDDLSPGLSYPERLHILEKREEAWAMLDFRRSVKVFIPFNPSSQYDFTGGTFLLGTRLHCESPYLTVGYSCISLPSLSDPQDQNLEWKECSLETQILDVGLAVGEHDLIAAVTAWVLPVLLVRPKFDFREAKAMCAMYLRGV